MEIIEYQRALINIIYSGINVFYVNQMFDLFINKKIVLHLVFTIKLVTFPKQIISIFNKDKNSYYT